MCAAPPEKEGSGWARIASVPRKGTTLAEWHRLGLGDGAVRALLRQTGQLATRVACSVCGCRHRVERLSTGLVGVCDCDPPLCGDIPIEDEEALVLWALDDRLFYAAIRRGLGLREGGQGQENVGLVGWFPGCEVPMVWSSQSEDAVLAGELAAIRGRWPKGAVVLLPSLSALGPVSQAVVSNSGVVVTEIGEVLELDEGGA